MEVTMKFQSVVAGLLVSAGLSSAALAAGDHVEIPRVGWSFSGMTGTYDKAQLQRGFQVYKEVCSNCHGLSRVYWRNLVEAGGPEFPEDAVKALAAEWPNKITDGPNDEGQMIERSAGLPDPIRGPYKNEKEARAAQNGAYPLDLSLIAKGRSTSYTGPWWYHPIHMGRDILNGYQEGGPDYIHAILTGYTDIPSYWRDDKGHLHKVGGDAHGAGHGEAKDAAVPAGAKVEQCASVQRGEDGKPDVCVALQDGMNYNAYFPGHQIAMPAILADGAVKYKTGPDGKPLVPETLDQHAKDISAFLAWASDPHLNVRKAIGWQVMLYLLITTVLLFLAKKRIWSRIPH
ncbi:MAG: cytochrome c1 [Hyphomicrobium sp.]|nr:cytochrome c1 [Hyphomicrobium sp.]